MHPAKSIILFTSLSGLGFGLLAFLCLGVPPVTDWIAFVFFAVAFAAAGGGLIASTFHLGHPERALKAFTQWRTSWLSREGWLAVATLAVTGLYAALVIFTGTRIFILGALGSLLCVATTFATSMIYAQLKTVPRWNHWTTSVLFVGLSLAGGALLSGSVRAAILLLLTCGVLQFYAWKTGDSRLAESGSNMASATGLGDIGTVTAFEPPHTGGNYLTDEMVFVVARKHALKLRSIALVLTFLAPALLLLLPFTHLFAAIAVASHVLGLFTLRWLFFAEAEHVVGLYYGRR
ncbi:MAG: dimethyl sulfoxide reductase anchor subunit [Rhodobacter sp.]|nr:dimethyl sulfoxide reductase anchor subunit [Rhodobacter sp.]